MRSALFRYGPASPALPLARQPAHQRAVHPGPLVLGAAPRKSPTPTTDRDRTVSRRSEPSSRTALMGEQPNPWDLRRTLVSERSRLCLQPVSRLPACYGVRRFAPLGAVNAIPGVTPEVVTGGIAIALHGDCHVSAPA